MHRRSGSLDTLKATPKQVDKVSEASCEMCKNYERQLQGVQNEKLEVEHSKQEFKNRIKSLEDELEREVQKRCELEERFTEEARRSCDQIAELIAKSDQDDVRLNELKRKFDAFIRENTVILESHQKNREVFTKKIHELRRENDFLLGKFITQSQEIQDDEINLPQKVEDLQFHCLTLRENLILATMAKERLEQTLLQTIQLHKNTNKSGSY